LAVTGGVILAGQALSRPSVAFPAVLEIAAIVLELAAIVMLVRIRPFAWDRFRLVFAWGFVAYVIQGGMIEWAFARNHTPGRPLAVLTLGIVVFATVVPLMIAFTVARYQAVRAPD
jgi:apolipoprotein N-acyltransferase